LIPDFEGFGAGRQDELAVTATKKEPWDPGKW